MGDRDGDRLGLADSKGGVFFFLFFLCFEQLKIYDV